MCMSVLSVCISVQHVCAWYPQSSEEEVGSPRSGDSLWVLGIELLFSATESSALKH